jgi:hypothetical protein
MNIKMLKKKEQIPCQIAPVPLLADAPPRKALEINPS